MFCVGMQTILIEVDVENIWRNQFTFRSAGIELLTPHESRR